MTDQAIAQPLGDEDRRRLLKARVDEMIAQGYRFETVSDHQAVYVLGKPVNHILHLILSIVTLGFWLLVWLIMGLAGGEKRRLLQVDGAGVVHDRKL